MKKMVQFLRREEIQILSGTWILASIVITALLLAPKFLTLPIRVGEMVQPVSFSKWLFFMVPGISFLLYLVISISVCCVFGLVYRDKIKGEKWEI